MNDRPPQFILAVPAEVLRLLTGIQSSLQRLEAEVRDLNRRAVWARPAAESGNGKHVEVVPVRPAAPLPATPAPPPKKRGPYRSSHISAGPEASKRMLRLLARTALSGVKLAEKLGTHQTTVSMVKRGRLGISQRLHEAMKRLEAR